MELFVKEYAKYKKDLIYGSTNLSWLDKRDALNKIDITLELCEWGCISNESAMRIILEV